MFHNLFRSYGQYYYGHTTSEEWSYKVRLSIFLVYSECVGLPALVWAFRVLRLHQKSDGRTLVFVSLLLHNDILELLLNLFIITALLNSDICNGISAMCPILMSFWWGSRICGVLLQQMVALERILSLRHPFCSAHVFSPCFSFMFYLIMLTAFFLCELFTPELHLYFSLMLLVPVLAVTITSWIFTCRKPPIKLYSFNRDENQDYTVLAFATLTAVLYMMSLVLYVLETRSLWVMCLCLLSLRLITDAPLCVLICREKHSQTHTDLSTDPAATQTEHTV